MDDDPLLPLMLLGPRDYRSWPKHDRGRPVTYHPLSALLTTAHAGDAHFSAYSRPDTARRLSTDPPAYAALPGGVPMAVFMLDLDCKTAHRASGGVAGATADDTWWGAERPRFQRMRGDFPGGYVHRTRGGARALYRLAAPHVIDAPAAEIGWKKLYLGVLAMMAREYGLHFDPSISDWPRAMRLPFVVRDGVAQHPEVIGDPRAIGALHYDPEVDQEANVATARELATRITAWGPAAKILAGNVRPTPRTHAPRAPQAVAPRAIDAGAWAQLAADLGRALLAHAGRHAIHLALAGACYARGVPLEAGPELARAICTHSGERDDRPQVWGTTADRIRGGQVVTGYGHLHTHWPDLAAVVDAALPADGGARAARDELDARGVPAAIAATEGAGAIRAALADPPPGLTLVRATEGAGKTRATAQELREAAEAAAALERIPSARKVLYVAPTHAVAAAVAEQLRGVRAQYLRGVLAVRHEDGSPACAYHVPLAALLAGGHAASTWCDGKKMGRKGADAPCPKRDGCAAAEGGILDLGPKGAPPVVMVTVHALLAEGLAWAGPNARVVIDEDPAAVEAVTLTRAELEAAAGVEGFSSSEGWRVPILRALAAGLERGDLPVGAEQLRAIFARGCAGLEGDDGWCADVATYLDGSSPTALLEAAAIRAAWTEVRRDEAPTTWHRRGAWAPRPHPRERARVFHGASSPRFVEASRTHAVVARILAGVVRATAPGGTAHAERAVVAIEVAELDPTRRVLRAVIASPAVASAFHRWGPTVLLDATADVAVLRALAGGDVPVTEVRVADGAQVTRRLLYWSGGSRRTIVQGDVIRWDLGLGRYAHEALRQALAHCPKPVVGLFALKVVADRFRAALGGAPDADPVAVQFVARARAGGAELIIGHYWAARGRDDWKGCDVLISLGDPRPDLGATKAIAAVLGLSADHSAVYRRAVAAEASQVAGRLRAPWRERPALHVHVGSTAPASWDARAEVHEIPKGIQEVLSLDAVAEAVTVYGSQRLAAAALGVTRQTVSGKSQNPCDSAQSHGVGCNAIYNTDALHPTPCDTAKLHDKDAESLKHLRFEVPAVYDNAAQRALIAAAGGAPKAAALLGASKATAYHWASGGRRMPAEDMERLRALLAAATPPQATTPARPTAARPDAPEVTPW